VRDGGGKEREGDEKGRRFLIGSAGENPRGHKPKRASGLTWVLKKPRGKRCGWLCGFKPSKRVCQATGLVEKRKDGGSA
jgi:hypothetical protein